jgi:hypothetical protein
LRGKQRKLIIGQKRFPKNRKMILAEKIIPDMGIID